MSTNHHKINYIEMPAKELENTKAFFQQVFGWSFTDFGPDYSSFVAQGTDGGFYRSDSQFSVEKGAPLLVLYSQTLEQTQERVEKAGGVISKAIFSFPGGRRFHFVDPSNNEFAVWSE